MPGSWPGGSGFRLLDAVWRDAVFGFRGLRRTPGFTAAVVFTIALGVGVNTAVFSMVDGVLLRGLPFGSGDRLVVLHQLAAASGAEDIGFSVKEVVDYRRQSRTLDGVAEYHSMYFNLFGRGEARRVQTGVVSADYFPVLGVRPALGRLITQADDQPGAPPVLVLSHGFWREAFGSDPRVIGSAVEMNDRVHTIVGVLPPLPPWPDANDVYMPSFACPFRSAPDMLAARDMRMVGAIGRLRAGVTLSQASSELATLAASLKRAYPEAYDEAGFTATAVSVRGLMSSRARVPFLVLLGATLCVLVLVSANIATLMLARLRSRERELAVRAALGASRRRLLAQLVVESMLVSLGGGAAGVALAAASGELLVSVAARFSPRAAEIGIDGRVLLFAFLASAGTGLAVALVAAFSRREPLVAALKDGGHAASERGTGVRRVLVAIQVALSFVLLIGAGLLARSLVRLEGVDPGFDGERVLSVRVDLDWTRYNNGRKRADFYRQLLDRVSLRPGVERAAVSVVLPLYDPSAFSQGVTVDREAAERGKLRPLADVTMASPDYLVTVGIPLVGGRWFADRDTEGAPPVAAINRTLARHRFPGSDPLGRRISFDAGKTWITVVGVVGDVRQHGLDQGPRDAVYLPMYQQPTLGATLLVRSDGDPTGLAADIRRVVRGLDERQPVERFQSLEQVRAESLASRRLTAALIGLFALLALAVTCAGVVGVVAFGVSRRVHELGIRVALGADRSGVVRLVVRQALEPVLVGLAIGILAARALSGVLGGLLYEVRPTDAATFAAAAAVVAVVAALACLPPVRRALRISPLEALRET